MSKVYVIRNDFNNNEDYEDNYSGDVFVAVCASLEAAVNYLRHYEDVLRKMYKENNGYSYYLPEFVEAGIDSKFRYESAEYFTICHELSIYEEELIGG